MMINIPPIEHLVQYPIYDPGPASNGGWELLAAAAVLVFIAAFEYFRRKNER